MITHRDQVEFILGLQGRNDKWKLINGIHHVNRLKKGKSCDTEKTLGEIQIPFLIKKSQQIPIRRRLPQSDKGHSWKNYTWNHT